MKWFLGICGETSHSAFIQPSLSFCLNLGFLFHCLASVFLPHWAIKRAKPDRFMEDIQQSFYLLDLWVWFWHAGPGRAELCQEARRRWRLIYLWHSLEPLGHLQLRHQSFTNTKRRSFIFLRRFRGNPGRQVRSQESVRMKSSFSGHSTPQGVK